MQDWPPFDPNTRRPSKKAPPGSWDTQTHIYGPQAKYPWKPKRSYNPPEHASLEELKKMHDALGIQYGVITQATVYGTDCSALLEGLKHAKGRYVGLAIIDGTTTEKDMDRLTEAGIQGARFNFAKFLGITPDRPSFERCLAMMVERNWIMALHVEGIDLLDNEELFKIIKVPVVMDHMLHYDLGKGLDTPEIRMARSLLHRGNWYMRLSNGDRIGSGATYDDVVPLAQTFITETADRVLWGTDWPHVFYRKQMPNDADLLDLFYKFAPDETLQKKILVDNPKQVYRIA